MTRLLAVKPRLGRPAQSGTPLHIMNPNNLTFRLKLGDESLEIPVTQAGIDRFEKVSGVSILKMPDHPNLSRLLPCLIWALVNAVCPRIRAEQVIKVFEDPEIREASAKLFLKQIRPSFDPLNN